MRVREVSFLQRVQHGLLLGERERVRVRKLDKRVCRVCRFGLTAIRRVIRRGRRPVPGKRLRVSSFPKRA